MRTLENLDPALVQRVEGLRGWLIHKTTQSGYSRADAEDIVSDALISFYLTENPADPRYTIFTKLLRALGHRIMNDRNRRRHRIETCPIEDYDGPIPTTIPEAAMDLVTAIKKLPPHVSQAVLLVLVEGHTREAVGAKLGLNATTIDWRVQRGIELLRLALG